jgi:hypothetical protein
MPRLRLYVWFNHKTSAQRSQFEEAFHTAFPDVESDVDDETCWIMEDGDREWVWRRLRDIHESIKWGRSQECLIDVVTPRKR